MKRDVIIIVGRTGSGKSQWAKIYTRKTKPLYVYDPLLSYPGCEIDEDGEILKDTVENPRPTDRVMIFNRDLVSRASDTCFVRGNCTLLLEECSTIWPKGARLDESMSRQIFLGRHRAVNLILMAQRATSIPIDLRSQANRIVSFGQIESDDLAWLGEFFGKERAKKIPDLKPFSCFDYHDGAVSTYNIKAQAEKYKFFPIENESLDNGELL